MIQLKEDSNTNGDKNGGSNYLPTYSIVDGKVYLYHNENDSEVFGNGKNYL